MGDALKDNRRLLVFIILSNFLLYFGFQVWQSLFNNFAVEQIGVRPGIMGVIQAVREVPGLLGFVLGFLALFLSETRIMSASLVMMGLGMMLTGGASGFSSLLVATFLMSLGFHFFYPGSNAILLMAIKKQDTPRMLGNLGSLSSIASVAGTALVYLTASAAGYRTLFFAVGGLVMAGGVLLFFFGNSGQGLPTGRRVTLRRRYWLFYALSFLLGSRRHIYTTFAVFLLVREHHVTVQTTAMLFLINGIINVFTLRITGQLVGRLGERLALSISFFTLALVFVGYAYVKVLPLLFALFILDNILFGFGISLTTYFQKIAVTPGEITSNLSAEQAINHIAAIVVPLIGGAVWELYGAQAPFLFGVVVVLAGLILAQRIRTAPEPSPAAVAA
jgi:predicted MFS family arabinose efflux permease